MDLLIALGLLYNKTSVFFYDELDQLMKNNKGTLFVTLHENYCIQSTRVRVHLT